MLSLLGVCVVVLGFLIRINPLLVIAPAAFVTGLVVGLSPVALVFRFGAHHA
ncbi:MAG TPA: DUF969 family protein [Rhizomicrobium sp.]|jgi:uncharacterized membrane protein|nr:DUF969 family protein [Rhizomicrobium sp.]